MERVFFLLTMPCSRGFRPLFTRSIVEQTGYVFVKQTYSITIQTYVVPSAIVYSRMLLAG